MIGTSVSITVIPILTIAVLHASSLQVGLLWFVDMIPWIVLAPFVGVFADRLRRRPILVGADLFRCAALAILPVAYVTGHLQIGLVFVTIFAIAVGDICFDVAHYSYVPTLVRNEQLIDANSKLQVTQSAAIIVGPGLAGVIVQLIGAPFALIVDAVSYLASASLIASIKDEEKPPAASEESTSIFGEMGDGFRFIWSHPLLRPLTMRLAVWQFVSGALYSMVILYAISELGATAAQVGFLFAAVGLGFFVAASVTKYVTARVGVGAAIIAANVTAAYGAILLPLAHGRAPQSVTLVLAAMFVYGLCTVAYQINNASLRQALTPSPILGRMSATTRTLTLSMSAFGGVFIGTLASLVGLRTAIAVIVALGVTFATVGAFFAPLRGVKTLPAEAPAHA